MTTLICPPALWCAVNLINFDDIMCPFFEHGFNFEKYVALLTSSSKREKLGIGKNVSLRKLYKFDSGSNMD